VTSPTAPAPGRLSIGLHAAVLGGSLLLVAVFTYPLVRDPGHLLPYHKDPMMYGWTMVSNTRRLLANPLTMFHGNTFYPHGNVVAHTDLLLTPTLFPAGPIYLLTRNPVLQYNLTLLLWWALSGWAMYVLAYALLRSHAAAAIAAVAFTVPPFRTDFYLEFQMQLAFPIPLALLALLRFLETRRVPYLAGALALLWVEALASMYYAIILGLCLVTLALLHFVARAGTWSWRLVLQGAAGALALGLALAPFIVPYAQNRSELGMERDLYQSDMNSADILTYFETGDTHLYQFSPSGHVAETSIFMGFVALGLTAVAFGLRDRPETPPPPARLRSTRRVLAAGVLGSAAALALIVVGRSTLRAAGLRHPRPFGFFVAMLLLILARIAVEGWWAARRGARGRLSDDELRWVVLFLVVLFFLLSLGPVILYGRKPIDHGLYEYLYPYLLPLHAIRVYCRIGIIVVLGVALLAGMGARALQRRLPARPWRALVPALLVLGMLAEYRTFPLRYQRIDWEHPPAVYRAIAADPDDFAVLEWPQNLEDSDDYFTLMSTTHWKRIVNGASGFSPTGPPMTRDISGVLSSPDDPSDPFPGQPARRYLLGLHPLRYVIVHNDLLDSAEREKWRKLGRVPWARLVGRYAHDDLYWLSGDMTGASFDKYFSWDYARDKHTVEFDARVSGPVQGDPWIDVDLNGHLLGRREIGAGWTHVTLPLEGPRHHSAPNVVSIDLHYDGSATPSAGRRIGRTGVISPVDLQVISGGMETGDDGSIYINAHQRSPNQRGYNLVAIDPASGALLWSDDFDTFGSRGESDRLAQVIERLPAGTIVAAAVKDEASKGLTDRAVAAFRSLGGSADIRGQFRASHVLIGVKGARPGTAIEQSGYARLTATLGSAPEQVGVETRAFALR
jgi:interleukin-like EMT inducer protein